MSWKERSRRRQEPNCTYVFLLRACSEGRQRKLAGSTAYGQPGPEGNQAAPGHTSTSVGTRQHNTVGSWRLSVLQSITLNSLWPKSVRPQKGSYFQYKYWWRAVCESPSPWKVLSHQAGRMPPPGIWGTSPNTIPVLLAYHIAPNFLFQNGKGDHRQLTRSSPSPPGLVTGQPKQTAEQGQEMAKYCPPLASSHSSGTSEQGATVLPCVFPPSSLWGLLRASELMSLPKPDRGLPEAKQMFLSLGCWGQPWAMCHLRAGARAACRRSFLEDTIKQLVKCIGLLLLLLFAYF